ncbi:MAG: nucleotidyl transferase AbiEii/AbiGii toxin family protein [Christensenellales bacterium]
MNFTSAKQLKDWVQNLSQKTGIPAGTLMQNYLMERFVERVSVSDYRNNIILKGGYLIAAMIGAENRNTMDIDATLKGIQVNRRQIEEMVSSIIAIDLKDGAAFKIVSIKPIHEEHEYSDFRISLDVNLWTIRGNLKLDMTVGDVIIPQEITYDYRLMFDDRMIPLMAYNLYTILAEKIETILSRNVSNTRGRDFYDVHMLMTLYQGEISNRELLNALRAKAQERNSLQILKNCAEHLRHIAASPEIQQMWKQYTSRYSYAQGVKFESIISKIASVMDEGLH